MNIGEVAQKTGLPTKTIRYYEDIGLVEPQRGANGYRSFAQTDVHNLTFVQRARALGFSVDECRNLLDLYQSPDRASADVKAIAREHLHQIEQKISDLQSMQETLSDLIERCAGDDRPECPILGSLSDG